MNYIGQIIGILAIAVSFFIYIQPSRSRMVLLKLVTDFLWLAHHFLIFSYPAAATTGIAIFRELLFIPKRKNNRNIAVLIIFSMLFLGAAALTWKDSFSALPAAASVLSTAAFGNTRVRLIRIFALLSSVCMLIYGLHYVSIPTIINEVFVEFSIIVSLLREQKAKG